MKKYIVLLCFLNSFFLFAQKEITTKWYHDVLDTFHSHKSNWRSCLPMDMVEVDNDVIIGTYDWYGWTVRRIEKKTGKQKWLTAQTPDYPDSAKTNFYLDNLFLRSDGNVDVFGIKSKFEDFAYGWGNPIKVTYDSKTGERKAVHFPTQPNNTEELVIKPGALASYMPMDNGKGHYMMAYQKNSQAFSLVTLDSNLVLKDTLCKLDYMTDAIDKQNSSVKNSSKPKIGNHIYKMLSIGKFFADSTTYQQIFYKVDLKGNIIMRKKLGVPLYNALYYGNYKAISDGYLVYGLVDTTYKFVGDVFSTSMVAKVDTNGNVLWKAFLKVPDVKQVEILEPYEDKKRGGYWVMAGSLAEFDPYLFYIDKKGKPSFIANVNIADNEESTIPCNFFGDVLKDGSLLMSYQYKKAYLDKQYYKSYGLTMIEAAELNQMLASFEPDILPSFLVNIYPNPAHNELNINILDNDEHLQVECYDLQGRMIYQCQFQNQTHINTADWQRGLYAIVIRDELGRLIKTEKIVLE